MDELAGLRSELWNHSAIQLGERENETTGGERAWPIIGLATVKEKLKACSEQIFKISFKLKIGFLANFASCYLNDTKGKNLTFHPLYSS